jgi:hypothetical protein
MLLTLYDVLVLVYSTSLRISLPTKKAEPVANNLAELISSVSDSYPVISYWSATFIIDPMIFPYSLMKSMYSSSFSIFFLSYL